MKKSNTQEELRAASVRNEYYKRMSQSKEWREVRNARKRKQNQAMWRTPEGKLILQERNAKYYIQNREMLLERSRKRHKDYDSKPEVKIRKNKYTYKMMEKHPERYKARYTLRNAVKAGKIDKLPCEVCGEFLVQGHHHKGYDKPLEVIWLCQTHHSLLHRKYA